MTGSLTTLRLPRDRAPSAEGRTFGPGSLGRGGWCTTPADVATTCLTGCVVDLLVAKVELGAEADLGGADHQLHWLGIIGRDLHRLQAELGDGLPEGLGVGFGLEADEVVNQPVVRLGGLVVFTQGVADTLIEIIQCQPET